MIDLSTNIGRFKLKNPLLLASGVLGQTAGSILKFLKNGAGGVTTKSISINPREGYPNPTVVEVEHGLLNAMGLPNPGIREYGKEIRELKNTLKKERIVGIIIGSIVGKDEREFGELAKKMEVNGVNAIELNLSCPHAKGYGSELGSDPSKVKKITNRVKSATTLPIWVKLPPISEIVEVALSAEEGGADAVVAINTLKGMTIDLEVHKPILSNQIGGYSGPGIKPIGIRVVYEISKEVNIPVVGCGGITYGKDLIEYLMAGASAGEIGSAIYYRGKDAFKKISGEASKWLFEHGYSSLREIIGLAHN
jgi:dihydroorotate dehydrogenase (NAD+) catalytic subunit